jgi:phosphoglycerol transferase MdoB-like AlkP superfamily enzyme
MLWMPLLAEGGSFNWIGLLITGVAIAVFWLILRTVLKLTVKIFFIGCVSLAILTGIVFLLVHFLTA